MRKTVKTTTIVDYGMGNLRNVERSLTSIGGKAKISSDPETIRASDRLILPGVGAFGDAMKNLRRDGLDQAILESVGRGTPLLGLCLGLQLLFKTSDEFGDHEGLSLIPGVVRKLQDPDLCVPHVGWNQVENLRSDPLLEGIPEGTYFYFVHSYYVKPEFAGHALAQTLYGRNFCSIARSDNVWGAQFHPEKSQAAGRRFLCNFLRI